MTFLSDLSKRALALHSSHLPSEAHHVVRRAFADTIGVAIPGSRTAELETLRAVLGAGGGDGGSTIWGGGAAPLLDAVLLNATAAHVIDFDDCSSTFGGHPSAPLVPVIFALAELRGGTVEQMIRSYVIGAEVEIRLARGLFPHHYDLGWHPTATLGVFGAAAAAASFLGLGPAAFGHALGIAASTAAGMKSNFGTPVKALHVGKAAQNGLLAALLAERGTTASPEAFEHKQGFFRLYNGVGTYDPAAILDGWDGPLEILSPGIAIKQYPCCGSTHSAIDAALSIMQRHGCLAVSDILSIEVEAHEKRLAHTSRPRPVTGLQAKYSLEFLVAKTLSSGHLRVAHFDDATLLDAGMPDLLGKVALRPHAEADPFRARVSVGMRDGRRLGAEASTPFGRGQGNPMPDSELEEKFRGCAAPVLGAEASAQAFAAIMSLSTRSGLAELLQILCGAAGAGAAPVRDRQPVSS